MKKIDATLPLEEQLNGARRSVADSIGWSLFFGGGAVFFYALFFIWIAQGSRGSTLAQLGLVVGFLMLLAAIAYFQEFVTALMRHERLRDQLRRQ